MFLRARPFHQRYDPEVRFEEVASISSTSGPPFSGSGCITGKPEIGRIREGLATIHPEPHKKDRWNSSLSEKSCLPQLTPNSRIARIAPFLTSNHFSPLECASTDCWGELMRNPWIKGLVGIGAFSLPTLM